MRSSLLATVFAGGLLFGATALAQTTSATGTPPSAATNTNTSPTPPAPPPPSSDAQTAPTTPMPPPPPATPADSGQTNDSSGQSSGSDQTGSMAGQNGTSDTSDKGMAKSGKMMMHHGMRSAGASNIDASDTHSDIAPKLPSPKLGPDASPEEYLHAAQKALHMHNAGEAQAALEMAETRALDRSTLATSANEPDSSPEVHSITEALDSLSHHDWNKTTQSIDEALQHAHAS